MRLIWWRDVPDAERLTLAEIEHAAPYRGARPRRVDWYREAYRRRLEHPGCGAAVRVQWIQAEKLVPCAYRAQTPEGLCYFHRKALRASETDRGWSEHAQMLVGGSGGGR